MCFLRKGKIGRWFSRFSDGCLKPNSYWDIGKFTLDCAFTHTQMVSLFTVLFFNTGEAHSHGIFRSRKNTACLHSACTALSCAVVDAQRNLSRKWRQIGPHSLSVTLDVHQVQFSPGAKIKDGYVAEKMSPESPLDSTLSILCVSEQCQKKDKRKKFALIALAAPGF